MKFYVSIQPWAVYVKEADFFVEQGGLVQPWGKFWVGPIDAESIEDARTWGKQQQMNPPEGRGGVL